MPTACTHAFDNRGIIVNAIHHHHHHCLRCLHMPTIHQHRHSPPHFLSPSAFFLNVRLFIHFKLSAGRTPFVLPTLVRNIAFSTSVISLYFRILSRGESTL